MSLRTSIETLALEFTAGVLAAIRECSLEELVGDGAKAPREAKPARAASPRSSGRLARRSEEEISAMADRIVAYVNANGTCGAEQIRGDLKIDKKEWMKPLQIALDSKGLKKTGQKRATEYTVGGAKSAPKARKTKPKAVKTKTKTKTKAKAKAKGRSKVKAKKAIKKTAPKKTAPKKSVAKKAAPDTNGAAEHVVAAE